MIEILIVAALVLWSTLVVFKKVFPKTAYSVFMSLANTCQQKGWRTLAKWLQPKMAGGCGGHCACPASEDNAAKTVNPVKWK